MSAEKKCARCGERAETIDNLAETTFWGFIQTKTETAVHRSVRLAGTYILGSSRDTRVMRSDEERPLCDPCWSLLVGQFLQGRAVAPVEHEHEWTRGGSLGGYPMERCRLCMQDRIAYEPTELAS
jgi:hypothetical protein